MPFHDDDINDIVSTIMFLVYNGVEYENRGIVIYWGGMEYINIHTDDFDNLLMCELTKRIHGFTVVGGGNNAVFKIGDCYINMDYSVDFRGDNTDFTFTRLDYYDEGDQ